MLGQDLMNSVSGEAERAGLLAWTAFAGPAEFDAATHAFTEIGSRSCQLEHCPAAQSRKISHKNLFWDLQGPAGPGRNSYFEALIEGSSLATHRGKINVDHVKLADHGMAGRQASPGSARMVHSAHAAQAMA